MVDIVINIVIVLVILGFLITIHELGHFLSAKFFKVKVEAFAIGLGPKIWGRKIGDTEYRLNVLPIGGYVKILGEGDEVLDKKKAKDSRNFKNISKWKQIVVLLAGVTMNFIFAVIIYYFFIISSSYKLELGGDIRDFKPILGTISVEKVSEVEYIEVVKDGSSDKAGLPDKGFISSIDGVNLKYSYEFRDYVVQKQGQEVVLNVCVEAGCRDYPVVISSEGRAGLIIPLNYKVYLDYRNDKVLSGFGHSANLLALISDRLSELFSEAKETGDYSNVANNISGPVGIYVVVEAFKKYGFLTLLGLTADLSFSLAIMNLLPIPALDGGRVLLIFLEKLSGRFWSKRLEALAINISFVLLLLLMVGIIFKDIFLFNDLRELFR